MLRQLQNVLCAGDLVCIQHPCKFVAVDFRHMLQPFGKLIDALQLTLRGKIYAAQMLPQIHDLACRALNRDRSGYGSQLFHRCSHVFFFCRGRHREREQHLLSSFALP